MYDLEKIFKELMDILDQNVVSENKDFWTVYYALWRFLYSTNQNIQQSPTPADKMVVIQSYLSKYKDIAQIEKALLERNKVEDKEKIGSQEGVFFNPQIEEIKILLMKEQERLVRFVKDVKNERASLGKSQGYLKKASKKEKWLKS